MFPSWEINSKLSKWNENSIDFIFYSEKLNSFLCVELKNELKTPKSMLSAYCQTTERTSKFIKQYEINKIIKARKTCFENATEERGGKSEIDNLNFKANPVVKRILLANKFPNEYSKIITKWNEMNFNNLVELINNYSTTKVFQRFKT